MESPKVQKVSHWLSKLNDSTMLVTVGISNAPTGVVNAPKDLLEPTQWKLIWVVSYIQIIQSTYQVAAFPNHDL